MQKEILKQMLVTLDNSQDFITLSKILEPSNLHRISDEMRWEFEYYSNNLLEEIRLNEEFLLNKNFPVEELISFIFEAEKDNVYQFIFEVWSEELIIN